MKDDVKGQALKACEDIFHEYPEYGSLKDTDAIKRAWQAGELSCSLNNKKLQTDTNFPECSLNHFELWRKRYDICPECGLKI